jgi:hypothetical protein
MVFASEAVRTSKPSWLRENAASRANFTFHQFISEDGRGDGAIFGVPKNRNPT